jgi:hypothetical protein
MCNGVIINPPHEFKQPLRWQYRVLEVAKYEFGVIIYGITSIPNFMQILTNIIQLLNIHKWIPQFVLPTARN